jgi:hypothetical protein
MMNPSVTFKPVDPAGAPLTVALYDGYPQATAQGGWSSVARSANVGVTEFQGYEPISIDIPVIFDGLDDEVSMEPYIMRLYGIMRNKVGPRKEPAVVSISGPVPWTNFRWVINNIQCQDEIRRQSDGARIRGIYIVTIMEYVAGAVVVQHKPSPAKKSKSKGKASGTLTTFRYYTVHKGDTLGSIAAKLLHSSSKWHDIAKLNGIRDPNGVKVGRKLKIPRS